MPTFTGNPSGSWVPIVVAGVNRKIDGVYFGYNKLDLIFRKIGTDSLFSTINGVNTFVTMIDTSTAGSQSFNSVTAIGNTSNQSIIVHNTNGIDVQDAGFPHTHMYPNEVGVADVHSVFLHTANMAYVNNGFTKFITPLEGTLTVNSTNSFPKTSGTLVTSVGGNTADSNGNISSAGSATKLTTGRTISITGDVTYTSPAFDGTANVTAVGTVTQINGTNLSGLGTGIVKIAAGIPAIAANGTDYLSQTGTATGVTNKAFTTGNSAVTQALTDSTTNLATTAQIKLDSIRAEHIYGGRVDSSHLFVRNLNLKYPLRANATNDTAYLNQSWLDSSNLILTTTGSSGAANMNQATKTLNIPNYSDSSTRKSKIYGLLGSQIKAEPISGDLSMQSNAIALISGTARYIVVYLPSQQTITGVKWFQSVLGSYTATGYNGIALYSLSGGTLTLIDSTVRDGTIWQTAASATWASKAFPSTHLLNAGVYVVELLYIESAQTTAPQVGAYANATAGATQIGDFTNSNKLNSAEVSATLPHATIAMSALSVSGNMFYVGVY